MTYLRKAFIKRRTPQHQPLPGTAQVENSAGGFAWAVDDWTRLDRFLILGNEGGSYYATARQLTIESAEAVRRCIEADAPRTIARIVEVSVGGRAPKNDPALFALAMAAAYADEPGRKLAFAALPRVARTGTHLLHFAGFVENFRGWGRGLRRAIAAWYEGKADRDLAYQIVKYQGRDGWTQRDLLRLAHPKPENDTRQTLYHWITQGWPGVGTEPHPDEALRLIWAFEKAKRATSADEVIGLIRDYGLPREAVPTVWLRDPNVWAALLDGLPITATIRNLATLTRIGLLVPGSGALRTVVDRLGDGERLRRARVHPIQVLAALKTYAAGRGERGKHIWTPLPQVVDALDNAFYAAFGNVPSTGKRWMLAIDVSGSMDGGTIAGVPGLTPRVAAGALALVTANTERDYTMAAFTAASGGYGGQWGGGDASLTPLAFSPRQRLDDVIREMSRLPMGGTDCSLPMRWALQQRLSFDVFMVLTDSETWAGPQHPSEALRDYRQAINPAAKLVVAGMVANDFTIADPNDAGMLDIVGFDTAAPTLIADFATDGAASAAPAGDEE